MSQKNKRKNNTSELKKIVVNTDGGSRGNPGPSAIGVVIATPKGEVLKEYGQKLDDLLTNNEAEYEAVIFALKKIKALFGKERVKKMEIEFRVDSELIASQINNQYKVEEERLQLLYMRVHNLRFSFDKIVFKAIPREENTRADGLLNRALDADKERLF